MSMNKIKKIKLAKLLIGSSLLLSTIGFSLALTSCGKGSEKGGKDGKDIKPNYLCDINPKLFDKNGEDGNKNLVAESDVESFLNETLDETKGYNKDFFSKIDSSFKNSKFFKNDSDITDITKDLGDVVVYYLNIDSIKPTITFDLNQELLNKFTKIEELKKFITLNSFKKMVDSTTEDSNALTGTTKLLVNDKLENNISLSFYGKENDNDKKIDNDEDVSKIEKVVVTLPESGYESLKKTNCLCGLLVKFSPISNGDDKAKTIVVKFVKDDEFKYLNNKEIYENVNMMKDDYFVNILEIDGMTLVDYIQRKIYTGEEGGDVLDKLSFVKYEDSVWKFKNYFTLSEDEKKKYSEDEKKKYFVELKKYLNDKLSLTLDEKKSLKYDKFCFDSSLLPKKIDNKECKYQLCFKKENNENNVFLTYGKENTKTVNNVDLIPSNLELDSEGKFVVKLTLKQLDVDLVNKDIEIKFI